MGPRVPALVLAVVLAVGGMTGGAKRAEAQLVTPFLVAMLSGPISDGASIILLKKKPGFVSVDTVVIACAAGMGAGLMASFLPALFTLAGTGVFGVVDWAKASIYPIYGCIVSGVGGIGGALTELVLTTVKADGGHAAVAVAPRS